MNTVWVLSKEHVRSDYSKEEVICIFKEKPTPEKINEVVCNPYLDCTTLVEREYVYCEGFYYELDEVTLV